MFYPPIKHTPTFFWEGVKDLLISTAITISTIAKRPIRYLITFRMGWDMSIFLFEGVKNLLFSIAILQLSVLLSDQFLFSIAILQLSVLLSDQYVT